MSPQLLAFCENIRSEADGLHFVAVRREEDLHLEFKQKADGRDGVVGERDHAHLSEALSGFANAAGGVLIFGVGTRNTTDGPERADALRPIVDAGRFRVGLLDLLLQTVQPSVDGVRVEMVPTDADPNVGYVKCLSQTATNHRTARCAQDASTSDGRPPACARWSITSSRICTRAECCALGTGGAALVTARSVSQRVISIARLVDASFFYFNRADRGMLVTAQITPPVLTYKCELSNLGGGQAERRVRFLSVGCSADSACSRAQYLLLSPARPMTGGHKRATVTKKSQHRSMTDRLGSSYL
jgi:hypothetical protein